MEDRIRLLRSRIAYDAAETGVACPRRRYDVAVDKRDYLDGPGGRGLGCGTVQCGAPVQHVETRTDVEAPSHPGDNVAHHSGCGATCPVDDHRTPRPALRTLTEHAALLRPDRTAAALRPKRGGLQEIHRARCRGTGSDLPI